MVYKLFIRKEAKKTLQNLPRPIRNRIAEKIKRLEESPNNRSLDIKKLQNQVYYRLRVGQWRIIFERDDQVKIITIEKIKPRGDVYK